MEQVNHQQPGQQVKQGSRDLEGERAIGSQPVDDREESLGHGQVG
jgi:hypothetical protein